MISIQQLQSIEELSALSFSPHYPFQTVWYLNTFIKHFCDSENILLFVFYNDEICVGYAGFEKVENKVVFLGMKPVLNGQELTDYGDIVLDPLYRNNHKESWDVLLKWFSQNGIQSLQLDYVREDSQTYELFKDRAAEQTIAPYITLQKSWDEYIESLDRVDRKELKRKMKRLNTITHTYTSFEKPTENDFKEFVRLHKLSSGEKDEFMSSEMRQFFWDFITVEKKDWKINLCFLQIEKKNTSAILSFENDSSILGYNSGYDPSFNYYSVGLLLHAYKIKEAIEKGKTIYDFMRGTERYKYDLGGKDIKLYKIEIPSPRITIS